MQGKHHTAFVKQVRDLSRRHEPWRVFADFCEAAALAQMNAMPHPKWDECEERYLKIIDRYSAEEARGLAHLLGIVTGGVDGTNDFLGEVFGELELGNKFRGQFFTPYSLARLMAESFADDIADRLKVQEFITVGEPACGAGGVILALCDCLMDRGIDYQRRIHVTATDVDPTAAYMAYLQLNLRGVPAIVQLGNTLSLEIREELPTLFHRMWMWDVKLRRGPGLRRPTPMVDLSHAHQADLFEESA